MVALMVALNVSSAFSLRNMGFGIINVENKYLKKTPTLEISSYRVDKGGMDNLDPHMLVESAKDSSIIQKIVDVHYGDYGSGTKSYFAEQGIFKIADHEDPDDYCLIKYKGVTGFGYKTDAYNFGKNINCSIIGSKHQKPNVQVTYTNVNAGEVAPKIESIPIITETKQGNVATYQKDRLITITSGTLNGYNFTDGYNILKAPHEGYFQFDDQHLDHFNLAFKPYEIRDPSQSTTSSDLYVVPNASVTLQEGKKAGGLVSLQNIGNENWHNARTQFIYSGDAKTLAVTQSVVKSLNKNDAGEAVVNSWSSMTSAPIDTSKKDVKVDSDKFNLANFHLTASLISNEGLETIYANGLQQAGITVSLKSDSGAISINDKTVIGTDGKLTLGDLYKHIFFVECADGQQCNSFAPISGLVNGTNYSAVMDDKGPYADSGNVSLIKQYKNKADVKYNKQFYYSTLQKFKTHYIVPIICVDQSGNNGQDAIQCTVISDNVITIKSTADTAANFMPLFRDKSTLTFNNNILATYGLTHIPLTYDVTLFRESTTFLSYPLLIAAPLYIPQANDLMNESSDKMSLFNDSKEFTSQKSATVHVADQYGNFCFQKITRP